jgi:hypothetical protein
LVVLGYLSILAQGFDRAIYFNKNHYRIVKHGRQHSLLDSKPKHANLRFIDVLKIQPVGWGSKTITTPRCDSELKDLVKLENDNDNGE